MGSGLSSILLNTLGRKNSILLSGFIFFTSFLLIGVADLAPDREVLVLAGRAISGLGVGLGVPSTAIYIAECSSPQLRGKLSSLPALLLALGVLLGYLLGRSLLPSLLPLNLSLRYISPLGLPGSGLLGSWLPPPLCHLPAGVSVLPDQQGPDCQGGCSLG